MSKYCFISISFNDKSKLIKDDSGPIAFKQTDSVSFVLSKYSDLCNPDKKELVLFAGKEARKSNEKLSSFISPVAFTKHFSIEFFVFVSNKGGSKAFYDDDSKTSTFILGQKSTYVRELDLYDKDIPFSNDVCCLLKEKNKYNVKMSCGHTINATQLFNYMNYYLTRNEYDYTIKCPECKSIWKFMDCAYYAALNEDEYNVFNKTIQTRAKPQTKKCPNCKNETMRPDNLTMNRVRCKNCNKQDWCWKCAQNWKDGGFIYCGNQNCSSYRLKMAVEGCTTKNLGSSYGNIIVPIIRKCTGCNNLIMHKQNCKHMTCDKCSKQFCFSCLKDWPCTKSYKDFCKAAPKQTIK